MGLMALMGLMGLMEREVEVVVHRVTHCAQASSGVHPLAPSEAAHFEACMQTRLLVKQSEWER